ncbi:MAG: cytochrome P450 [Patiriisocius sp.]|jgi:cytochrome P450
MEFLNPALIQDPYPHYLNWRENQPIWKDETSGHWVLTRHDDVRAILKNSAHFSSQAMGNQGTVLPLLTDDPPRHTQLRGLVNKAFTVRMLKSIEPEMQRIAKQLVAKIEAGASIDIVTALTTPLPVAVISQMMGIPSDRAEDFKRWSDALTGTLAGSSMEEREQEIMEMAGYFHSLIADRRENPGDDLVSAVVNAEIDGERLEDGDIVGFNILLLIAGNETTTNLLGNLLNILVDRPALFTELAENPDKIDAAIEESLRFDGPVQFLMRKVTETTELHGQKIAVGDVVQVVMGSANRDQRAYEQPDEFLLTRAKNHHHTFGFGIHFCIGAPLARLEAKIAMRTLLFRFTSVERGIGENERVGSHLLRGFHHLNLIFNE